MSVPGVELHPNFDQFFSKLSESTNNTEITGFIKTRKMKSTR